MTQRYSHRGAYTPYILSGTPIAVTGDGATIWPTAYKVDATTGAGAEGWTLNSGQLDGQMLCIQLIVDGGGDGTLTPVNLRGGTSIVFADVGDTAVLIWNDGAWEVVDLFNRVDGATAPAVT